MAQEIKIGSLHDMPAEGEAKEFAAGPRMICVARVNGELCALDNVCAHRGGPLGQGMVMDGKITCPWHGWQFDPHTGCAVQVPDMGVSVYKLRVEGEDVFVEVGS